MVVKAGKFITTAQGVLLDRLQNTGTGNINVPKEKIYETGNELAVASIRDTPTMSWELESYDVSCEPEALMVGLDPDTLTSADIIKFTDALPYYIAAPFKAAGASKTTVASVAAPHLTLESAQYRMGVGQTATQTFSFSGDSVYYPEGTAYYKDFPGGVGTGEYDFDYVAIPTLEKGTDVYAYGVTVIYADGTNKRLFISEDFTNDSAGITLLDPTVAPAGSRVRVLYASATPSTYPQAIHPTPSVKPAALRGKDIDLFVAINTGSGQQLYRWKGVQSVEAGWSVSLEHDDELGNPHHVSSDYDVPEVTGSITVRPESVDYLFTKIAEVTNTGVGYAANLLTSQPLEMEARFNHPETGALLKTIRIPDARFDAPAVSARVQQRIDVPFAFESDSGAMEVIPADPY